MGANRNQRYSNSHDDIERIQNNPELSAGGDFVRQYHSIWGSLAKIATQQTDQIK